MTTRYRIVFIIDVLGMGGAERLMVPTLKHLDFNRFKPRVCVFRARFGNPVAEEIRTLGIPVDYLPVRRLRDLTAVPRLLKYLRRHRADLVHTQLEFADILGNIVSKLLRLPSVCTLHTLPPVEKRLKARARQRLSWESQRRFCDRVISVSKGAREHYLRITRNSPSKVMTIYNGIDIRRFENTEKNEQERLRQTLGIPADAPLIITVAMLRPQKGIEHMIDALPTIIEAFPDVYYLVVGNGRHLDVLVDKAKESGVGEHVIFAGMRHDVPELLSTCDIFVLPTLTEALPTVLAEAMAARKPVIASAVGGVPEMITDNENGVLLPPGDPSKLAEACIRLLSDPKKREVMGNIGWETVNRKFNVHRQVQQLETIYKELLTAYGK